MENQQGGAKARRSSDKSTPTTANPTRFHHAFHVRRVPLPWRRAINAGLCVLAPLLCGAVMNHPIWGVLATIGGFTGVYATPGALRKLVLKLACVAIGISLAFGLGTAAAGSPWFIAGTFALVSGIATLITAGLQAPPPGAFFFVLSCAIGTGMPLDPAAAPSRGAFALIGGGIAIGISVAVSFAVQRTTRTTHSPAARAKWHVGTPQIAAAMRMAVGIFISTLLSYALGNHRPYWVAIGCAAVLAGGTVMATIHRSIQRAIGTTIGVLIAGALFAFHPSVYAFAIIIFLLQLLAELFIVRNYGLAVIFITPLALTIAEIANVNTNVQTLIGARLLDTMLGCAIGLSVRLAAHFFQSKRRIS